MSSNSLPPAGESTFADLVSKVGAFGAYQKLTLVLLFVAACVCGQYTTITPYLFYEEEYSCSMVPQPFSSCLDYVCSLPLQTRAGYIAGGGMRTLASKFGDFRCSTQANTINIVILIMYVGIILAYLMMAIMGGYFGRKTFVIMGSLVTILGTLLALQARNLYLAAVGLLLGVFGVQIVLGISFNIISQIVQEDYRESSMVVLQAFYSMGHLTDAGFYFWLRDWEPIFVYFFIIPMAVFLVAYATLAVETPIVLVTRLSPQQALKQFLWIARVNGLQACPLTLQDIAGLKAREQVRETQNQDASKFTLLDIFRYSSLRWISVILIIVHFSVSFLYFAPNLMLDQFQLSIFINGVVYGAASLVATVSTYFFINRFRRKVVAVVTFTIVLICSLVLIWLYRPKAEAQSPALSSNIGILAAIFVITFSITTEWTFFLVYVTELYPTQLRVIGTSLVSMFSAINLAVASFIINGAITSGFSVMIVFSIFAAVSLVLSFFLPQTLEKGQTDFIQELELTISRRASLRQTQRALTAVTLQIPI